MDEVRARFPEYDDMDDMTLANAIHGRFYSDMPLADFYAQVGFNPQQDAGDNGVYPELRPGFSQDNPIDLATVDRATAAGMTRGTWVRGPDGTVYELPSDPVEGQYRAGDLPQAPGVNVRPQSAVEDVAKSFPTGVVEGLTGLAGMQGTLGQMVGMKPGQYLPGMGVVGPSGEDFNQMIREGLGRDYYQPQTVAGEYSRTAGEFLPGVVAPGGTGARLASWLVPAATSETAGQIARGMSGGERDTAAEGYARMGGGLLGGLGVGGVNAVRGGADISLRNAAQGVTPQQLEMAALLRRDADSFGINLTNANAVQQVTGGGTGLGQLQRAVEGSSPRLQSYFAALPEQTRSAVGAQLDQIGPSVEPSALAPRVQQAAGGVLDTLRRRANEDAGQFYDRLPGQSLPPEQFGQLTENPSFAAALRSVRGDEELAPLLNRAPPMEQDVRMLRAQQQGFTTDAYHGTIGAFEDFDPSMGGAATRAADARGATFFTDSPRVAETFIPPTIEDAQKAFVQGGNIRPVRIRVPENVEPWDFFGGRTTAENMGEVVGDARANGGIAVARNVQDNGVGGGSGYVPDSTHYVVTDPSLVRSRFDPFAAPTPDNDLNVINEVVKQLDTMADEAAPNSMRVGGSMTRASQRREARALADALASEASPDWRMARDTVRGVNEAFIDPLKAGPIGALADANEAAPNLASMTGRLFPDKPFEGQAAETARALELMGEIDPTVGGPLVRQHLSRQAMESMQDTPSGPNQFGGADFAARVFGNPEQRRTVMGALDVVNRPDPNMAFPPLSANAAPARGSDPMANLVEVLMATGQRHKGGSQTAFIQELQQQMRNGNLATGAAQSVTNPAGVFGRVGRGIDDWTARRNAETLADLLMANSEEFNARLTRAINRPRGANRVRAGVALSAGQED